MAYKILFTEDALAELEALLSYIRADNATTGTDRAKGRNSESA